ncbi:MAG: hypothetical protein VR65_05310 [Desulfobulbaceae bacterium BRH_c16a]|nr:MAG: hypothetical protein VR65_05310 [Desulfobulbaceae bacterium BRH_c16a]
MQISTKDLTVSIPMPIFLVVEDVGWWQGVDGSAKNEPFRNGFPRRHCLNDYRALVRLAERLKMRIALGMVLGEWDRRNLLKTIAGATWMGSSWDNRLNQGPWLDEASEYLRAHQDVLEIACHGLCHEFWRNGRMERSEFHDDGGRMRPQGIIRSHLEAFAELLGQNNLPAFPRIFCPPALNHSFGNGKHSIQAILAEFGIKYVVTCFSRAHIFSPPQHEKITWECGVGLLERGLSPVPWHEAAARPAWDFGNPILPLHWGNLLHPDPEKNYEVVDTWAEMLINLTDSIEYILAEDIASCWSQAAAFYLTELSANEEKININLGVLTLVPEFTGTIVLKVKKPANRAWQCRGGRIHSSRQSHTGTEIIEFCPAHGQKSVELFLQ